MRVAHRDTEKRTALCNRGALLCLLPVEIKLNAAYGEHQRRVANKPTRRTKLAADHADRVAIQPADDKKDQAPVPEKREHRKQAHLGRPSLRQRAFWACTGNRGDGRDLVDNVRTFHHMASSAAVQMRREGWLPAGWASGCPDPC